jgi:CO/xanthine dehydrogenase FAD-binding subunit
MLVNLRTIHKPKTYPEAAELLKRPNTYPLYGSGASLIRFDLRNVEEGVDISALHTLPELKFGEGCRVQASGKLAEIVDYPSHRPALLTDLFGSVIKSEMPATLYNIITIGDLLMESNPTSLFIGLLVGLNALLDCSASEQSFTMEEWFDLEFEQRCRVLIEYVEFEFQYVFVVEKVSRTPSDQPIVGAIGFARATGYGISNVDPEPFAVVTGIADRPVRYSEGMQSTLDDYLGSAEYRTEMARVLSQRAIARAVALAEQAKS